MNKKIWTTLAVLYVMIFAFPMTVSAEEATIKSFFAKTTMAAEQVETVILDEDSLIMNDPVDVLDGAAEWNKAEYLGGRGVKLTWDKFAQDGLSTIGYIIYRYEYDFEAETIDETNYAYWIADSKEVLEFEDTTAELGKVYYYAIVGLLGEGNIVSTITSVGEDSICSVLVLERPKATLKNVSDAIKISWSKVPGADGYIIYKRKSNASWTEMPYEYIEDADTTYFNDSTITSGQGYYYRVTAYMDDPADPEYYWETELPGGKYIRRLKAPTVTVTNAKTSIKVEWNAVTGATGYEVYRDGVLVKTTTSKSWYDYNKTIGKKYVYTVKAYYKGSSGTKYYSETSASKAITRRLAAPNITVTNDKTSIKVAWEAVDGATGYEVYRDGVLVKTTTSKSWYDYNKVIGKKYVYTVKSYYKNSSGTKYRSDASTKKTIYRVPQTTVKSLIKGTGKFTIKYSAVSKATGYQITYSRYSSFKNSASKATTSLSKTVSGLTRNKTYYVKVRAYKTVNGVKYYGQYSPVKKITVK